MSNINVKNFVDINIVPHITAQNVGVRDTVVLFTTDTNSSGQATLRSLSEARDYCGWDEEHSTADMPDALAYLTVYFNNGGVKALVIPGKASNNITDDVDALDNKYICVAFAGPVATQTATYTNLLSLAESRNARSDVYGVNQKLIITRSFSNPPPAPNTKNFIVKYSQVHGAEMTIAAYLSKINVYRSNTVYDYMFTAENLLPQSSLSNDLYEDVIEANLNVDITLANAVRNCGGNCTDGDDIVNNFTRIVMQQTVTEAVLTTLAQKLKNQSGLNKIYSAISEELENYKSCGYLTTDKIWQDEDLYIEYNGKNYLIIENGTAIQNGYFIKILPFASLSERDRGNRTTPPIYVIVAEQYGIRKITINGEAI